LQSRAGKLRSRPVPLKGRFCRNDGAHWPNTQSPIGAVCLTERRHHHLFKPRTSIRASREFSRRGKDSDLIGTSAASTRPAAARLRGPVRFSALVPAWVSSQAGFSARSRSERMADDLLALRFIVVAPSASERAMFREAAAAARVPIELVENDGETAGARSIAAGADLAFFDML